MMLSTSNAYHPWNCPTFVEDSWRHEREWTSSLPYELTDQYKDTAPICRGRRRRSTVRLIDLQRNPCEEFPTNLSAVYEAIERSRKLLELPDDWDDAGSPVIRQNTWSRAVDFLTRYAQAVFIRTGTLLKPPRIAPGPDGSIDLHWDHPQYELLINFPADDKAMAGFYGDDRGKVSIKGRFDPRRMNEGLLSWLQQAS